jgi:hypothetical protein
MTAFKASAAMVSKQPTLGGDIHLTNEDDVFQCFEVRVSTY